MDSKPPLKYKVIDENEKRLMKYEIEESILIKFEARLEEFAKLLEGRISTILKDFSMTSKTCYDDEYISRKEFPVLWQEQNEKHAVKMKKGIIEFSNLFKAIRDIIIGTVVVGGAFYAFAKSQGWI